MSVMFNQSITFGVRLNFYLKVKRYDNKFLGSTVIYSMFCSIVRLTSRPEGSFV